jgi:ABC-type multidrug transport system fused ATPase/permease subunit
MAELIERSRTFFFRAQLAQRLIPGLYQNVVYLLLVGGLAVIYAFDKGGLAALGAVVLMLVRAGSYGNGIQAAYQVVKQSLPFIERVDAAERRYRLAAPSPGRRPFGALDSLSFDDVTFAYEHDRPVLSGISFDVSSGEAVGIIGPSGAGKSTLAQLLLRLREPTSGAFLINGDAARELRSEDWTARVACVPQLPNLIDASAADNIRYFRELSQPEVERAARLSRIHDDIMSWPDGYESPVGARGAATSVGQAQRICLARALAGRPAILLLDEPTSALDPTSERLIQESLAALKGTVTLFIIAHRTSMLDICDRVMVIVDGKLDAFAPLAHLRGAELYHETATSRSG